MLQMKTKHLASTNLSNENDTAGRLYKNQQGQLKESHSDGSPFKSFQETRIS